MLFELKMDFRRGRWKQSLQLAEETGIVGVGSWSEPFSGPDILCGLEREGWGPAQTLISVSLAFQRVET